MGGWHHRLNGHEFAQTSGDSKGQGSLVCCSPWRHKKSDMTEQLNNKIQLGYSKVKINLSFRSPAIYSGYADINRDEYYAQSLSCVQLFAAPWTVAPQTFLTMEFSRQEYWTELAFPTQGIFATQGLKPCLLYLLHGQVSSLPLSHLESLFPC